MTKVSYKGQLYKMAVRHSDPIEYSFVLKQDDKLLDELPLVNSYLGKQLSLEFTGKINCIACNRAISKTFNQGYCFPCMQTLAACDMCVLKPHLCHFDRGTCREPEWGMAHCFVPHILYLANSSGVKVGLTRETQVPTRWMDQGAVQSLAIMRVQSRYQAGLLEHAFAHTISDKTDWRKMLRGANGREDLVAVRNDLFITHASKIQEIASKFNFGDIEMLLDQEVQNFNYPVLEYPSKIHSLSFEKTPKITGTLVGIKGQYLMFDTGVINMRKYTGYHVAVVMHT